MPDLNFLQHLPHDIHGVTMIGFLLLALVAWLTFQFMNKLATSLDRIFLMSNDCHTMQKALQDSYLSDLKDQRIKFMECLESHLKAQNRLSEDVKTLSKDIKHLSDLIKLKGVS